MRIRKLLVLVTCLGGLALVCGAQSVPERNFEGNLRLDVDDQSLSERYHIAPTKEGFIGALEHSAPEVRGYAAIRLSGMGTKEAVPAILSRLNREDVPLLRVGFASAALHLGAPEGFTALKKLCQDANISPLNRMFAVNELFNNGREECFEDVLAVLRSRQDHGATVLAIDLAPRFKRLTATEVAQARTALAECLADFPLVTARAMTQIGGPWAAEALRRALAVEQVEALRDVFSSSLAAVEGRK